MRIAALALALLMVPAANAQMAADEVRDAVNKLFDGMRAGDSTMVRAVLHDDARFQTVVVRNGQPELHQGSVDNFVTAVGSPHEDIWDEKIWDVRIDVDDRLAHAWMRYAFYLGETFSHCGVNAFQLFHDGTDWKIIQITDTRRKDSCEMP